MSNQNSVAVFRETLNKMSGEIQNALPSQIDSNKFIRTTLTAVQMNPQILEADRTSILGSCLKAAQDGLLLDGREAALVIFNSKTGKKVQYMPMVGGILKKIRNSGELKTISSHVVYEKDFFEYELGDEENITHKPFLGEDRGSVIAAYAVAHTKDGGIYRDVMGIGDINKVRASSRAANDGPWVDWFDEMAKKTVLRRLAKRLPSSADLDQVLQSDNEVVGFVQRQAPVEKDITPKAERPSALQAVVDSVVDTETGEYVPGVDDATGTEG